MKLNIFQKITFLVYISIILLVFVFFVPYHNNIVHYSILFSGEIVLTRFLIYLSIPTVLVFFVNKYLETMNTLELTYYKSKGKKELCFFFFFASINLGTIFFLCVTNGKYFLDFNSIESNFYNFANNTYPYSEYNSDTYNLILLKKYIDYCIKNNIVSVFLISFFLIYVIRPLILIFKEMLNEVR
ncbi:hypothetical protein [Flavobacterium sp. TSSA_36]|uniref:hypothetical protein n=1 Tax=Flavobacterium sp. TSSA_36 TaxID=3447669 RepID=UPI003F326C37